MVALIEELVEEYQCPVILGGDYNGNWTDTNYKTFEDSGMVDVQRNGVATVYASQVMGHHTYPAYNEEAELTLPAENDNTGKYGPERSVDHIMLQNEEGVSVAVIGVVIDDCSMSGADHFPIFMDFSIQN